MERRDLRDDFGKYPPFFSTRIPNVSSENSGNNGASRPQYYLRSLPSLPNNLIPLENPTNGYSSRESILGRGALPENQMGGCASLVSCLGHAVLEDYLGEFGVLGDHQGPNNSNNYRGGDVIEAIHFCHHRNQEQQWPVSGISNTFNLETAMSRLNLSNTAHRSSVNAVGRGGLSYDDNSFDAWTFEYAVSEPMISHTGLASYTGTPEGFGPSVYTHYPYGNLQNGDTRFSAALQRQLQRSLSRERYAEEFPSRNYNNARFRLEYNCTSLYELRGRIYSTAKDECGYSFLEKKLFDGNPDDIEIIFWVIKDHLYELMIHQFAHRVVDRLIEVCNQSQMTQVLHSVVSDEHNFIALCNDMHGTHGVQNLLEHLTTKEQISMVVSALRCVILILIKNNNGHHVIMHCVKLFTSEDNKCLLNEVANNCLEIARDKYGCCALQKCVLYAQGEPREYLLEEIMSNCLVLSKDPYGNFVVQYVLEQKIAHMTQEIIGRLSGSFVGMCFDKYGSHVVEKCLNESRNEQTEHIINEIMHNEDFLRVVQSSYGNYVIQTALMKSKGGMYNSLVNRIQDDYPFLHSHPFGKMVLSKVRESRSRLFV